MEIQVPPYSPDKDYFFLILKRVSRETFFAYFLSTCLIELINAKQIKLPTIQSPNIVDNFCLVYENFNGKD